MPADGNQCTSDVCTAGTPSNPPVAAGAACSQGGGSLCNGSGACVACLAATDCPGVDDECQARTCTGGACGVSFTPAGTPLQSQTAGDCEANVCDGAGNAVVANDDTDLPNDNNPCTGDTCSVGAPVFTSSPAGTACGAAQVCDGLVKGLRHPGWPQDPWDALRRLVLMMVDPLRPLPPAVRKTAPALALQARAQ